MLALPPRTQPRAGNPRQLASEVPAQEPGTSIPSSSASLRRTSLTSQSSARQPSQRAARLFTTGRPQIRHGFSTLPVPWPGPMSRMSRKGAVAFSDATRLRRRTCPGLIPPPCSRTLGRLPRVLIRFSPHRLLANLVVGAGKLPPKQDRKPGSARNQVGSTRGPCPRSNKSLTCLVEETGDQGCEMAAWPLSAEFNGGRTCDCSPTGSWRGPSRLRRLV